MAAVESRPSRIGPITLEVKQAGERTSGKSIRCVRRGGDWKREHGRDAVTPRNRKGEATGNTNFDLNRRASLRPYRGEVTNRVLLGCKRHGRPGTHIGGQRWERPGWQANSEA